MIIKNKMTNKIKNQSLETLKEMANILMNNFQEGTDLVYDMVIDELEIRMPENDFIRFCDNL